jgi:lysozyme family protein
MNSNFDRSFELVIGHEGGYIHLDSDPGGETRWGISKKSYPNEDIGGMTLDRAKEIYKRDFWDKLHCSDMQQSIAFSLFDAGVNCGIGKAAEWLQYILVVKVDGSIGPMTLQALAQRSAPLVSAKLNAMRLQYHTTLPGWGVFSKGWSRRIADNILLLGDL